MTEGPVNKMKCQIRFIDTGSYGRKYKESVHLGEVGTVTVETELEHIEPEVLQSLHHATLIRRILQEGDKDQLSRIYFLSQQIRLTKSN